MGEAGRERERETVRGIEKGILSDIKEISQKEGCYRRAFREETEGKGREGDRNMKSDLPQEPTVIQSHCN